MRALLEIECLLKPREIFTLSLYIGNKGGRSLNLGKTYLGLPELPNSLPNDMRFRHLHSLFIHVSHKTLLSKFLQSLHYLERLNF